jgi:hypothetical protein
MNTIKTLLAIGTTVVGAIGLASVLAYKSSELGVENYVLDGIEIELKEAVSGNIKVTRTEFSVLASSPKYGVAKIYVKKHVVHVTHGAEDIEFDINDTDIISQVVSAICVIMEDCEYYYDHGQDLPSDDGDDISNIDLYPVTIKADRYYGTYSGGKWQAWYCDSSYVDDVLYDSFADDVTCAHFWTEHNRKMKDETEVTKSISLVGLGDTPNDALIDLNNKVKFRNECIDKINSAKQKSDDSTDK